MEVVKIRAFIWKWRVSLYAGLPLLFHLILRNTVLLLFSCDDAIFQHVKTLNPLANIGWGSGVSRI